MLPFEPVDYCGGLLMPMAQDAEQVLILFWMVNTFRERIEVVDHRVECLRIDLLPPRPDFAHQVFHSVQDCGDGPMLVAYDSQGPGHEFLLFDFVSTVIAPL